jgi:hypothetical protein
MREEPSLETLWLQNIETMDKVQRIDRSIITVVVIVIIKNKNSVYKGNMNVAHTFSDLKYIDETLYTALLLCSMCKFYSL